MNIQEGNNLILKYLGFEFLDQHYLDEKGNKIPLNPYWYRGKIGKNYETIFVSDIKYHSDWNQLMPVVSGIIKNISIDDRYKDIANIEVFADIKTTWQAVVDYIKSK